MQEIMSPEEIAREGVKALIEKLGYANTIRFLALMGGKGDSVKELLDKTKDLTIEEIVEEINLLRKEGKLMPPEKAKKI